MPIRTTCIGAYPKPSYLPIRDWFDVGIGKETYKSDVIDNWTNLPEHDALFRRATAEAIQAQISCGISIPTDGEQRRENYVHYQCRHISGFDFANLEHRVMRNGAYETHLPAIRGEIKAGDPVLPRDFLEAQEASDRPVKITMPGPLTIMDTTADCFYGDDTKLTRDIATVLNKEVLALVKVGCKHIQIDEPIFARKPEAALSFGIESMERIFHGVPNDVSRIAHMCCGYPDQLDNPEYPKADHKVYNDLVEALDGKIDALSIEDCHCKNDLNLFEKFKQTAAIVGFVDVAVSRIESVDEILERMKFVLQVLPPDKLIAAPDCGLGFLGAELTKAKLTALCEAAEKV
tara:strand:- start:52 stop:1092 length:1041 start_codon:yes stop_codon:yes gene_type:complete